MVASHSGCVLTEVLVDLEEEMEELGEMVAMEELEELEEALDQPSSLQPRVLLRQEFQDLSPDPNPYQQCIQRRHSNSTCKCCCLK